MLCFVFFLIFLVETNRKDPVDPVEMILKVASMSMDYDNLPKCWKCNARYANTFIQPINDFFICLGSCEI